MNECLHQLQLVDLSVHCILTDLVANVTTKGLSAAMTPVCVVENIGNARFSADSTHSLGFVREGSIFFYYYTIPFSKSTKEQYRPNMCRNSDDENESGVESEESEFSFSMRVATLQYMTNRGWSPYSDITPL